MKKALAAIIAISMMLCLVFVGCSGGGNEQTTAGGEETTAASENQAFDYDAIQDDAVSADGTYEIAFVTDVGQLKDQSFNQGTWEGIKRYASENSKTYKYYQPANGDQATDDDRYDAMKAAADAGAKIVVCAGFLQETALKKAAAEFTSVNFVFIDKDSVLTNEVGETLTNVACISFREEQSGYLAGIAAVKEGYTKLGFSGGGGGENPPCCRFGYGFVQGADAAAKELNITVDMQYSWAYGSSFSASAELQTMLNGWYASGTEVIFACGGSMCQSAFEAAGANDGKVIGVDVDQSTLSDTVITSATKGLREAVMYSLEKFYANELDALFGVATVLGAAEDAVGLPTTTWSLEKFTLDDYGKALAAVKDGSVIVDNDYSKLSDDAFANVNLSIIE